MKTQYIDNINFAKHNQIISDKIDLSHNNRLQDLYDSVNGSVDYTIKGTINNKNMPALKVTICGKICTLCQNCLEPIEIAVNVDTIITIFATEADLDEALFGDDTQYDDGVLADETFDINNFIEDEIIMLMPIAPKHDRCKTIEYKRENSSPFLKLKQLLK